MTYDQILTAYEQLRARHLQMTATMTRLAYPDSELHDVGKMSEVARAALIEAFVAPATEVEAPHGDNQ